VQRWRWDRWINKIVRFWTTQVSLLGFACRSSHLFLCMYRLFELQYEIFLISNAIKRVQLKRVQLKRVQQVKSRILYINNNKHRRGQDNNRKFNPRNGGNLQFCRCYLWRQQNNAIVWRFNSLQGIFHVLRRWARNVGDPWLHRWSKPQWYYRNDEWNEYSRSARFTDKWMGGFQLSFILFKAFLSGFLLWIRASYLSR